MKLFALLSFAAIAVTAPNAALEPADDALDFQAKLKAEMARDLDPRANSCTYYDDVNNKVISSSIMPSSTS